MPPRSASLGTQRAKQSANRSLCSLLPIGTVRSRISWRASAMANASINMNTVRLRKDGALCNISLTVSAITDRQGHIVGVSKIARDITERKEWEQALRDSEHRLRAFSGQLEQLVQARTEELTQSHDRLRGLATELNLAEQRERKRLAAELHDHLQQLLVL